MAPRSSVDQCSENEAEEPLLPETTNLIIQGDQTSRRYLLIVFGVGVLVLANLTQALIILRIVNKTSAKPSAKYHPDCESRLSVSTKIYIRQGPVLTVRSSSHAGTHYRAQYDLGRALQPIF